MRRPLTFHFLPLVAVVVALGCASRPPEWPLQAWQREAGGKGLRLLVLEGDPYTAGLIHGRTLAQEVRAAIDAFHTALHEEFGEEGARRILDWLTHRTKYFEDLRRYAPELVQEMRGIAEGAGVSFEEVWRLQLREMVFEAAPLMLRLPLPGRPPLRACTLFATRDLSNALLVGQSIDAYASEIVGPPIVFVHPLSNGSRLLRVSFAGEVGGAGLSSKGFALMSAGTPQGLQDGLRGLPPGVVSRLALASSSRLEAIGQIADLPRAGSATYVLADRRQAIALETSSVNARAEIMSRAGLARSNHLLRLPNRVDIPQWFAHGEPINRDRSSSFATLERLRVMRESIASGQIAAWRLRSLLGRPPIYMRGEVQTSSALLIRFQASTAELWSASSNARGLDWQRHVIALERRP